MKKMFRTKDRRKIMRNKSQGSTGSSGADPKVAGTTTAAVSGSVGVGLPTTPTNSTTGTTTTTIPLSSSANSLDPKDLLLRQQQQQQQQQEEKLTDQEQAVMATPTTPSSFVRRTTAAAATANASAVPSRTLHRTTASLASYRATPITKHYSINNQILVAFEQHYENELYTISYALGLQFVETALLEIPKHGYFYSTRHVQDRITNSLNAIRVSNMLEEILTKQRQGILEKDDNVNIDMELQKVQKLQSLAQEQASYSDDGSGDVNYKQYEKDRARIEKEINEMKKKEVPTYCGPLFDSFTESMSSVCPPSCLLPSTSASASAGADTSPPTIDVKNSYYNYNNSNRQLQKQLFEPDGSYRSTATPSTTTTTGASTALDRQNSIGSYTTPPPLQPQKERSMSTMMREIQRNGGHRPDPPSSSNNNMHGSGPSSPPPPPLLDGNGWSVVPETIPARPEFGRQMSNRTYADHIALERALYLSGLEVQPENDVVPDTTTTTMKTTTTNTTPAVATATATASLVDNDDDDRWMLEHALKESEREMEKIRLQEEQQLLEACQASEQQAQQYLQQQYQQLHQLQQQKFQHHQQQQSTSSSTTTTTAPPPQLQRRITKSRLEIVTLHMLYHEDFVSLWDSGRIRVTHVDTYQGKCPGSTNGCTVIAPLLCIHHFINYTDGGHGEGGGAGVGGVNDGSGRIVDDPGLPDETVKTVIDEEVPSILPKVREELGVVQDAFLIPSDSHDYLLKSQLLSQDQFVTVIGGNILDEGHLNELIRTLVDGCPPSHKKAATSTSPSDYQPGNGETNTNGSAIKEGGDTKSNDKIETNGSGKNDGKTSSQQKPRKNSKIACTLFFHEHVVSILKLHRALDGKAWYDIIDSLPSRAMLSREVGTSLVGQEKGNNNVGGGDYGKDLLLVGEGAENEFGFSITDSEPPLNTARIRCLDEEALSVALKWYACAKFSSENLNYIDNYPWDDNSTDFDPRVFQAFVWTEAS